MADLDLMMEELQGVQQQQQQQGGAQSITIGGVHMGAGGGIGGLGALGGGAEEDLEGMVWYQVLQHPLFTAGKGAMDLEDEGKAMFTKAMAVQKQEEDEEESGWLLRNLKLNLSGAASGSATVVGGSERIDGAILRVQGNPYDLQGWRMLLAETESLPMSTVRPVWRVFKTLFPRSGYYLAKYASKEMEDLKNHRENLHLKLEGTVRLCNLFYNHLAVGMNVSFYKVYIEWLRSPPLAASFIHSAANRLQSPWGSFNDNLLEVAFKTALSVVGRNIDSTSLWQDYVEWYSRRLSTVPQPTGGPGEPPTSPQQRWIRGMYHHILQLPIDDLKEVRSAYEAFERASRERARFQLEDRLEKTFNHVAKVMYPERQKQFQMLDAKFLPRPLGPPSANKNGKWRCDADGRYSTAKEFQDDIFCYELWEQIIATEKRTEIPGAAITDQAQVKRINSVLKQRLCYFPFDLGCWLEAIEWFQNRADHEEVSSLMTQLVKQATPKESSPGFNNNKNNPSSSGSIPPLLPYFVYADYLSSNIKSGRKGKGGATATPSEMLQTAMQLFDKLMGSIKAQLSRELGTVADLTPQPAGDNSSYIPSTIWVHLRRVVQLNKELVLTHCVMLRWVRFALWGTHGATASRLVGRKGLACPKPEKAMMNYITETVKQLEQLDNAACKSDDGSFGAGGGNVTSAALTTMAQQVLGLLSPFFTQWIDVELDLNRGTTSSSATTTSTTNPNADGDDADALDEGSNAALSLFHGWAVFLTDAVLGNASPRWSAIQCGCDTRLTAYAAKLSSLFPKRRVQIEQRLGLFKMQMMKRLPPEELWPTDPQTRLLVAAYQYIDTLDGPTRVATTTGSGGTVQLVHEAKHDHLAQDHVARRRVEALLESGGQFNLQEAADGNNMTLVRHAPLTIQGGGWSASASSKAVAPDTARWNRFEMQENRIGLEKKERQQRQQLWQQQGGSGNQRGGAIGSIGSKPKVKSYEEMSDAQLAKLYGLDPGENEGDATAEKKMPGNMFGGPLPSEISGHRGGPVSHIQNDASLGVKKKAANGEEPGAPPPGGDVVVNADMGQGLGYCWMPDVRSDLPRQRFEIQLTATEPDATNEEPPTKRARHEAGGSTKSGNGAGATTKTKKRKTKVLHKLADFLVGLPNQHACIGRFPPFLPNSGLNTEELTEEAAGRLAAEMEGYCEPVVIVAGATAGGGDASTRREEKKNPQLPFEPKVHWLVEQLRSMDEPVQ